MCLCVGCWVLGAGCWVLGGWVVCGCVGVGCCGLGGEWVGAHIDLAERGAGSLLAHRPAWVRVEQVCVCVCVCVCGVCVYSELVFMRESVPA